MKEQTTLRRAQDYQGMYQILTQHVLQAQERMAGIGKPNQRLGDPMLDQRIMKTKREFEQLLKEYEHSKEPPRTQAAKSKKQEEMEEKRI